MKALTVVALAAFCGCHSEPTIRAERFVRASTVERNALVLDARGVWTRPADPPPPFIECEMGARLDCGVPPSTDGRRGPAAHCVRLADGSQRWARAECNTPLLVSFDPSPVVFTKAPAVFTVGNAYRSEWVTAKTPWLALDRDGSGCIEGEHELFAGFDELAVLDTNRDGRIDKKDPAFAELVLWADRDQDKRCKPNELTLLSARFDALPLAFTKVEPTTVGSYEGDTALLGGGARLVDVHLAALP